MQKELRPIEDRANLGYRLRVIRNKIRDLKTEDPKANAATIQKLASLHDSIKRDYIFVIHSCS